MLGPVELLNIQTESPERFGASVPALAALVDNGLIHILDLVFLAKTADGEVTVSELDEMDAAVSSAFGSLDGECGGLLSDDDIAGAADGLSAGASSMLLLWENLWAKDLFAAIDGAEVRVADDLHLPRAVVESALSSLPADGATGPDRSDKSETKE